MFGLFKNKKKELAKEVYGVFRPKILLCKKLGKWKSNLSFGDVFIDDDYLLGFFNTYLSIVCVKFGYSGKESGLIMQDVYGLVDETYGDDVKLQQLLDRYLAAKSNETEEFKLGADHAAMFFLVFANDQGAHKFSKDPIYKEANKHFQSGGFEKDNEWAKEKMPKDLYDGDKMSNAPSNIVVAHRIFEKTFDKKLQKVFKVD